MCQWASRRSRRSCHDGRDTGTAGTKGSLSQKSGRASTLKRSKPPTPTVAGAKSKREAKEMVMRVADQGCDIVRITVQGRKEADKCYDVKNTLVQEGCNVPLVADIHFAPAIAIRVAECFDKIGINPGNFANRRAQFETLEYTEKDFQQELEHVEKVFTP